MLSTTIANFNLENCFYNAAGVWDTERDELITLMKSNTGAVVSKSSTYLARKGNPLPRVYYQEENKVSINSTGLANHGYKFYLEIAPDLKTHSSKPYIVSVATLCHPELDQIIEELNSVEGVDLVEFNFSCPNVIGKRQVGYNLPETERLLKFISDHCKKPFGLKLPPYFEPLEMKEVAEIIRGSEAKFLTCINSLGNGLILNNQNLPAIKPKDGLGGVGGPFCKPFGLANVREFKRYLPELDIIGCGGISTAQDMYEYFLCGASAVQIGTHFLHNGITCFEKLEKDFKELLREKGLSSVREIR